MDQYALSLFDEEPRLLALAQRITETTGAPILGGIAVFLHGYRRTTADVDLFAADPAAVGAALESMGATWDPQRREHLLEGVPVHLVTAAETGAEPSETEVVRGVRIVSLKDLVRFKLASGLHRLERARDLADVVELIRAVPLDQSFAAELPKELRAGFKKLVKAVRSAE